MIRNMYELIQQTIEQLIMQYFFFHLKLLKFIIWKFLSFNQDKKNNGENQREDYDDGTYFYANSNRDGDS